MNTPTPPTDKDALIASLLERIEVLMAQNAALAARVVELEAKLGLPPKTPDNSSLPPSKGQKPSLPSVPKRKAKPHPGAHRLLHPNPTRHHDVLALSCQACGADVSGAEQSPCETYDRVEIPTIEPDVTRVSLHGGTCPCCARRFKAEPPAGLEPGSPFGPNIRAFVIYLRAVQGIPLARLRDALLDLFGLTISEGALVNMLSAAAAPFKAAVSLIKVRLLGGTAIASDETGVRVGRANWWLWVFHHGDSAVFVADAHRSKAVVEAFLGDHRPDFWTSDRLGAQAGWARKEHQVCLAHLIRDVQYAIEAGDAVLGPGLKHLLERACAIGRRRAEPQELHPESLRGRPGAASRPHHGARSNPPGRDQAQAHDPQGPIPTLRLRPEPRPRGHQQRVGAGAATLRGLPKDHQRLPPGVGRASLRRHQVRHRDRATTLRPRHRRHPPHAARRADRRARLNGIPTR